MKQYLITDPLYYSNDAIKFKKQLIYSLKNKKVDIACFRDKTSSNYEELATIFIQICKEFKIKLILLNEQYELAHTLGANGVHLTSKQFDKIESAKLLNLYVIISCHTIGDINIAQKTNVDAITYSPIFETPNKLQTKGISDLEYIISMYKLNIIALGGIVSQKQINLLKPLNIFAFASIRYFI